VFTVRAWEASLSLMTVMLSLLSLTSFPPHHLPRQPLGTHQFFPFSGFPAAALSSTKHLDRFFYTFFTLSRHLKPTQDDCHPFSLASLATMPLAVPWHPCTDPIGHEPACHARAPAPPPYYRTHSPAHRCFLINAGEFEFVRSFHCSLTCTTTMASLFTSCLNAVWLPLVVYLLDKFFFFFLTANV
jgi:hypothetical protein